MNSFKKFYIYSNLCYSEMPRLPIFKSYFIPSYHTLFIRLCRIGPFHAKSTILVLWYLGILLNTTAQVPFANPEIFTSDLNLPTKEISNIVEDNDGFLWISGEHGLQRFDGSQFQVFQHDPKDSTSIVHNTTLNTFFDRESNKLWIPTWGGGLSVMNVRTGKCKNYYHNPDSVSDLPNKFLRFVMKDRHKNIWVAVNEFGILKYRPDTDDFETYQYTLSKQDEPNASEKRINFFQCHAEDLQNDSIIWIGTISGLLKFNKFSGRYQRFTFEYPGVPFSQINDLLSIFAHQNGKLYLGTYQGGFLIFDTQTYTYKHLTADGQPFRKEAKKHIIKKFHPKGPKQFWVSSLDGLSILDTEQEKIVAFYENDFFKAQVYGINFIDTHNNIYTWGKYTGFSGKASVHYLYIYSPLKNQVEYFRYKPLNPDNFLLIRDFLEVENDNSILVVGQYSDGLCKIDRSTGEWKVYPPDDDHFKNNVALHSWDIVQLKTGEILFTEDGKIYQWNTASGHVSLYPIQLQLEDPKIRKISEDHEGNIWIGTYYYGPLRINPRTGKVDAFEKERQKPGVKEHLRGAWDMAIDRNDNIWIKASKGISVYHSQLDTFYHFPYVLAGSKTKSHIQGVETDALGRVWINTHDLNALGITDPDYPQKGIVLWHSRDSGLQQTNGYRLTADPKGYMWHDTQEGLERIDIHNFSSKMYASDYGLAAGMTVLKFTEDRRMLIGMRSGFGVIHADSIKINQEIPKPYLSSFKIFDKELNTEEDLFFTKAIQLLPDQNFFSFTFSAQGFSIPTGIQFQYKLEGFDPEWVNPQERRYAAYTNVSPGDYVLKLKACNSELQWSEPTSINIHILAPWYQRWWAYLAYALVIGFAVYKIIQFQRRRQRLKHQLFLEQKEAERLKELDEAKNHLFTNITHEFRTPLTIILGLADEVEKKPGWKFTERIQLLKKNGQHLLQLVNQMLDLSRADNNALQIHLIQDNIIGFMQVLTDSYHSYALSKHIGLQFFSESKELLMDFDPIRLQHVLSNLLSNAFKFTPEYGQVLVVAKHLSENKKELLEIRVKDTGIGIPREELTKVFDRFHQVDSSATRKGEGAGIGLALVKELVDLMKGKVWVESELGKGSTFFILLPVERKALPAISNPEQIISASSRKVENPQLRDSQQPQVLVIEDNVDVIYYLKACLKESWQVLSAKNGVEGIQLARKHIPDAIICDVMMPLMNGFEVCEQLKQDEYTSHIPILLLTAKASEQDKIAGLSSGADAYLIKPFNKEELLIRLGNFLKMQERQRQRLLKPRQEKEAPGPEQLFLNKVSAAIEANMSDADFNTNRLSQTLGMSRVQLHRKLKAIVGMPTSLYIRHYRLQHAKQLLENTDLPISEVAWQTGFNNLSWFSQAFRAAFDQSPSETRK